MTIPPPLTTQAQTLFREGLRLQNLGQLEQAHAIYQRVLKLQPKHFDALHMLGVIAALTNNPARAIELIDKAIQVNPNNASAHSNRGNALSVLRQYQAAIASYNIAITIEPDNAMAYVHCGIALSQSNQHQAAIDNFDKAIAIKPDYANAYFNRGVVLAELKQYQAAIASYHVAITIEPDNAIAHVYCGIALSQSNQHQAAIDNFDKAIAIKPDYADAYFNRGVVLAELKQYQAAIASYHVTITIEPDNAIAHVYCGIALCQTKQHQAAVDSFDRAIAVKPDYADAYFNRGIPLVALNQYQEAIISYDRALFIKPDSDFLYGQILHTRMHICDWSDADNEIAELMQKIQRNEKASQAFAVLASCGSLSLQRKAAQIWANEKHPSNPALGPIPKRTQRKKIRLGYFSMDFRNHPVAYLMAGLFETHARKRFEVFAFSLGFEAKDEMRTRLEAAFDQFIDVKDKSDKEIAKMARELEIDIAIDLAGFTGDSRTGIFALRAAPVQVNYLGYPGTMGTDYIDYLIADRQLIPEEAKTHYAEKIVYLPDTYMASDSKRSISDKKFTREELGLPVAGFVFCCFNNSYKITPATFDGWMRILKQVDNSVLWLSESNATATINLRKEAVQRGVDPQRLVFAKKLPLLADHLARHRAADLFIDTLPFNAHTTASDALWAGLPVLTCTGEAFASRVAASLLTAIDLPELITSTQEDYEALAIELATHPERLKVIKQKLDHNRLSTPLFNTKLFTKHIEDAYTQMVERYQADLAPEHIYVEQYGRQTANEVAL